MREHSDSIGDPQRKTAAAPAAGSDSATAAKDIDEVEQGFGRFSEQIASFKSTAKAFVNGMAA